MARPILFSLGKFWRRRRGLVLVTLATLAVRLWWNLRVHRPLDFNFSDMNGYLERANFFLDQPWKPGMPHPYGPGFIQGIFERLFGQPNIGYTLFPYGTHALFTLVKLAFGRNNGTAIGVTLAVMGTMAVSYTYASAELVTRGRWSRLFIALLLIVYYPWISLGGYALSETPFALCVAATAFHGLRLADEGRPRNAWMLGIWATLGAIVRPQMLMGVALLGLHWLFRRRAWKNFRTGLAVRAAVPLAIGLAISSARMAWHTGEWNKHPPKLGLVSTNGPMNAVFGRCHNTNLSAKARDSTYWFGPPSLGALLAYEKEHHGSLLGMDPVFGETITVQGHMWDEEPNKKMAESCVKKSGWLKQVKFAVEHVMLLWGYNIIWPDQGQPKKWKIPMQVSCIAHCVIILPPAAIAMLLAFRKRRARIMLLALPVWSVVITAMLYFGDTRYRAPYDGLLIVLAVITYPEAVRAIRNAIAWLWGLRQRLRRRSAPVPQLA